MIDTIPIDFFTTFHVKYTSYMTVHLYDLVSKLLHIDFML